MNIQDQTRDRGHGRKQNAAGKAECTETAVQVREYCRQERLIEPGDGVVAGVSGGADSLALLRILCILRQEWDLRLTAVHIHHGIRGREASDDMEYVCKLCREWKVELRCFEEDVPEEAAREHLTLEEAGRMIRYRRFEEVRKDTGSRRIAVAHHMDDQAETVLMNLARGSGLRGMAGILPKRGAVVRPLLCLRRQQIEAFLRDEKVAWRTDSTNSDDMYLRNRIRLSVMPVLTESCNPRAAEHIAAAAKDLQEADSLLREMAKSLLAQRRAEDSWYRKSENADQIRNAAAGNAHCRQPDSNRTAGDDPELKNRLCALLQPPAAEISCGLLQSQPHLLGIYLLREVLEEAGIGMKDISRVHLDQLLELAYGQSGRRLSLPGGLTALASQGRLRVMCAGSGQGITHFFVTFDIFPAGNEKKVTQSSCVNCLDYDKIKDSLKLRHRQPGDRICIAQGIHKKIKEYLIETGMPVQVRDRWPMLAAGNRIIWIPGYRTDESCRVSRETKRILQVTLCLPEKG